MIVSAAAAVFRLGSSLPLSYHGCRVLGRAPDPTAVKVEHTWIMEGEQLSNDLQDNVYKHKDGGEIQRQLIEEVGFIPACVQVSARVLTSARRWLPAWHHRNNACWTRR